MGNPNMWAKRSYKTLVIALSPDYFGMLKHYTYYEDYKDIEMRPELVEEMRYIDYMPQWWLEICEKFMADFDKLIENENLDNTIIRFTLGEMK